MNANHAYGNSRNPPSGFNRKSRDNMRYKHWLKNQHCRYCAVLIERGRGKMVPMTPHPKSPMDFVLVCRRCAETCDCLAAPPREVGKVIDAEVEIETDSIVQRCEEVLL